MKRIIFFVVIFAVCIGCKHEINKVTLSNDFSIETAQYMEQQKYMVMIYVDSSACTPCSLKPLFQWNSLRDKFEKNGIGILFIFRNPDERVVGRALKLIGTFHFIIDKKGKFKTDNNVFKYVKGNIFVMDKDNNVVMTKSPIANKKSWKSFIKIITQ
jgi:peroxiredoxin